MSTRLFRTLKKVPVPIFGSAATAYQFGSRKVASAPRYSKWAVPLVAGGLWFVWPAVDDEWKQSIGTTSSTSDPALETKEEASDKSNDEPASNSEEETVTASSEENAIDTANVIEEEKEDPQSSEEEETENTAKSNDKPASDSAEEPVTAPEENAIDIDDVIDEDKEDPHSSKEETAENEPDPYDNLPEEDESTTCTICLINRQGPCRPVWRKFERCMKDNTPKDDQDDEAKSDTPSMSEQCDIYMLPWISCIQGFRNRYTLIANDFFQHEMIGEVEKAINEDEKVLLENIAISSIVQVGSEWNEVNKTQGKELADNEDAILVEGIAKINLWDGKSLRPIEIAFVKDQDGTLLGYEQFFDFKKSIKGNASGEEQSSKVGACNFHVNPSTTKSIQIFALYRDQEEQSVIEDDAKSPNAEEGKPKERKQALFYSNLVDMKNVPVQAKEVPKPEEKVEEVEQSEPVKEE
jgi:hypothetical protein